MQYPEAGNGKFDPCKFTLTMEEKGVDAQTTIVHASDIVLTEVHTSNATYVIEAGCNERGCVMINGTAFFRLDDQTSISMVPQDSIASSSWCWRLPAEEWDANEKKLFIAHVMDEGRLRSGRFNKNGEGNLVSLIVNRDEDGNIASMVQQIRVIVEVDGTKNSTVLGAYAKYDQSFEKHFVFQSTSDPRQIKFTIEMDRFMSTDRKYCDHLKFRGIVHASMKGSVIVKRVGYVEGTTLECFKM